MHLKWLQQFAIIDSIVQTTFAHNYLLLGPFEVDGYFTDNGWTFSYNAEFVMNLLGC